MWRTVHANAPIASLAVSALSVVRTVNIFIKYNLVRTPAELPVSDQCNVGICEEGKCKKEFGKRGGVNKLLTINNN